MTEQSEQVYTQQDYLDTWSIKRDTGKLSLLQRLRLAMMSVSRTLISGQDPTKLALAVDISHWQGDVDVALMVRDGSLDMLIAKASDGKQVIPGDGSQPANYKDDWFDRNTQKAFDAKIPFAPYHYVQVALPDYTTQDLINWQWRVIQNAMYLKVPKKSFHAFVLDIEEKNATDPNAATVVMGLANKIQSDPILGQVPLLFYSSMSVYNFYPSLRDQLSYQGANKNLWMAQWVYNTTTNTSWENFWKVYVPKIDMKVLTPGYANWKMLQWSSSFILPGNSGRTDVNFYNGTPEQLNAWLKFESTNPPPPQPEPEPIPTDIEERLVYLEEQVDQLNKNQDTAVEFARKIVADNP